VREKINQIINVLSAFLPPPEMAPLLIRRCGQRKRSFLAVSALLGLGLGACGGFLIEGANGMVPCALGGAISGIISGVIAAVVIDPTLRR